MRASRASVAVVLRAKLKVRFFSSCRRRSARSAGVLTVWYSCGMSVRVFRFAEGPPSSDFGAASEDEDEDEAEAEAEAEAGTGSDVRTSSSAGVGCGVPGVPGTEEVRVSPASRDRLPRGRLGGGWK